MAPGVVCEHTYQFFSSNNDGKTEEQSHYGGVPHSRKNSTARGVCSPVSVICIDFGRERLSDESI